MRTCLLAGVASVVLGTSVAQGDALLLLANARTVQEDDTNAVKTATQEYSTGFYVRTGVGANLMTNVNAKTDSAAYTMDAGVEVNASFGYRFTKILGVELQTGFTWNAFNSFKQGSKPGVDAGGQLYQIPIAANFVVTVPLSEGSYEPLFGRGAELLLLAGGGGQWAQADMQDVGSGTQNFTIDDWTWRFQAGLGLNAHLTTNTKFGIYFMYSRTGDLSGTKSNNTDYTLAGLNNFAVGLNVSFRF